jgi:RNA polymerase sigma factor (TIGR02999 family)
MTTLMHAPPSQDEITRLLQRATAGDRAAFDDLLPVVYDELRLMAQRHLRGERAGHTLQSTALVHEVYLKLVDQKRTQWKNRGQFFAIAAQAMRRILVNHAKALGRVKRGGDASRIPLDEGVAVAPEPDVDLVALDEAMLRLEVIDPRKSRLVELRFFAGMTNEEAAVVLDVAPATVKRDWQFTKAWLMRELRSSSQPELG